MVGIKAVKTGGQNAVAESTAKSDDQVVDDRAEVRDLLVVVGLRRFEGYLLAVQAVELLL